MHGIDIGVAQADGALQRRIAVEQPSRSRAARSTCSTVSVVLPADGGAACERSSRRRARRSARRSPDRCARAWPRRRRADARRTANAATICADHRSPCSCERRLQPAAETEPAGQHVAALGPGEHPRNGAQRTDAIAAGAHAGREPMCMRSITSSGVAARKNSKKCGSSKTSLPVCLEAA